MALPLVSLAGDEKKKCNQASESNPIALETRARKREDIFMYVLRNAVLPLVCNLETGERGSSHNPAETDAVLRTQCVDSVLKPRNIFSS